MTPARRPGPLAVAAALTLGLAAVASAAPPDRSSWAEPQRIERDSAVAELLVRVGDIDNLGFGWPADFDPFAGADTPPHHFPWAPDSADPAGTDRIMVVSGYQYPVRRGVDGYTSDTRRPANKVQQLRLSFDPAGVEIRDALIQLFVDDFQAARFQSRFQVSWDGQAAPFLEGALNPLDQHGPIGKLVTARVPAELLPALADGELELRIDDPDTGVGDGYAIDFVRLLINPRTLEHVGTVAGEVMDTASGTPLAGVTLSASGVAQATTDDTGRFAIAGVPAGLAVVTATAPGYLPSTRTVDLLTGDLSVLAFDLEPDPGTPAVPPSPTSTPDPATEATSTEPPPPAPEPLLEWMASWPWRWIAPLGLVGLALLTLIVLGVVRPRAFDPAAAVRVAGSMRGLQRAPDQRLAELPGGRPGFWRHARVAFAADGSAARSRSRAVVILQAGPRGTTIFTRAAGLERYARRTRRWEPMSPAELAAGTTDGATYRSGDLHLRFG
ncbi:MAG: carboxypeptidase-like regulatory domain-containing protein [Myxococcota bacterium]|nr:carboxypeptidase-like regulatory domain-containing protein [Myxococcota bacterium]